ncbi:type VII secretion protein EccB [Skermania piniformis]|uniref:Type VII secretion protein EccB n=1 Tax=Skermania pinensis TaxID=39122 RepID=A0ABX8SBC0_9ACTN|nr:type VII secretion protein EccB [Skermania piniformis]QXQ14616.1 type VII secretion protein EccB [Skermania piniformis]
MPAQPTTRSQVSGYRFLVRRMEHALVRRDVRMLSDPLRAQSRALIVGAIFAALALAGCAVLALLRPVDRAGDAKILVQKDSGAMFVVLGATVHPVLNLASARLIIGAADDPVLVGAAEAAARPRGALVGIPGAPSALPDRRAEPGRVWTVCDRVGADAAVTTSVLVGDLERTDTAADLRRDQALLLRGRDRSYLVYDGKRAAVDPYSAPVATAFGLSAADARPVSDALLNAIPEVPAIVPPRIPGSGGSPTGFSIPGQVVGSVVQVAQGDSRQYYVVLRDGLQQVGAATAYLIRSADSKGSAEVATVPPDLVTRVPVSTALDVATFPESAPTVLSGADDPVACLSWRPLELPTTDSLTAPAAEIRVLTGRELPIGAAARPVTLARADGPGPNADAAYLAPGDGAFVRFTGIAPDSRGRDGLCFVADTGVRFGLPDLDTAEVLGLTGPPEPAPWQIVSLLAPGPALSRTAALVSHDGVAADPAGGALPDATAAPR